MPKHRNTGLTMITVAAVTYRAMHANAEAARKTLVPTRTTVRHADGTVSFTIDREVEGRLQDVRMRGETLGDTLDRIMATLASPHH